jgi:feruloyl-CoA synthase
VRVKGPNVFPGYWKQPELTAKSFDDEGYYLIGDAVEFVDPAHPERGLLYDGRVGEDFKLLTGTWVHVGSRCAWPASTRCRRSRRTSW